MLQELAELEELELAEQAQHAPSAAVSAPTGTAATQPAATAAAATLPPSSTVFNLPTAPTAAIHVRRSTAKLVVFAVTLSLICPVFPSLFSCSGVQVPARAAAAAQSEEERQLQELQASMLA